MINIVTYCKQTLLVLIKISFLITGVACWIVSILVIVGQALWWLLGNGWPGLPLIVPVAFLIPADSSVYEWLVGAQSWYGLNVLVLWVLEHTPFSLFLIIIGWIFMMVGYISSLVTENSGIYESSYYDSENNEYSEPDKEREPYQDPELDETPELWRPYEAWDGSFSLEYPGVWEEFDPPLSQDASLSCGGDYILLEVFRFYWEETPEPGSPDLVTVLADGLAETADHEEGRVLSRHRTSFRNAEHCERVLVSYTDQDLDTTTDYFIIGSGNNAVELAFKVLSPEYESLLPTFERILETLTTPWLSDTDTSEEGEAKEQGPRETEAMTTPLEESFPPPTDYSDSDHDQNLAPPGREPTCPVCGDQFGENRLNRCPRCRHFVHRATCLSTDIIPGGRLCNTCSQEHAVAEESTGQLIDEDRLEEVGTTEESVHTVSGTEESVSECPNCGTMVRNEDQYCSSCGRLLSSWTAQATTTTAELPRPTMTELKPDQRDAKIQLAVRQLTKLGGAAVGQQHSGNVTGYNKIQQQITDVGKQLKELGGIPMVDAAYSQLEKQASGSIVREITLAWMDQGGVDGWYM